MQNIHSPTFFIGKGGGKLISFGSGQPDIHPPKDIYKISLKKIPFEYGLLQGTTELRKALVKRYPDSNEDQFVITNGASEALDLTLRYVGTNGGKRILVPRPYYYTYAHLVELAGMTPVFTDLKEGKIDLVDFEKKIAKCDAVIINSPGNPTGTIQDIETLKEIEKTCRKYDKIIISDEVYSELHYERGNHLIDGEHVVTINSFSKTYSMCGYRVGYLHSHDARMVKGILNIKNGSSMNTSLIGQEMALHALKTYSKRSSEIRKIFKERRDLIYNGLKKLGLDLWKPEGAFYVLPKFPKKYGTPNKIINELYYKYNLIAYDGAWFGAPDRVRFSYALDKTKIKEGLKRLKKFLDSK